MTEIETIFFKPMESVEMRNTISEMKIQYKALESKWTQQRKGPMNL